MNVHPPRLPERAPTLRGAAASSTRAGADPAIIFRSRPAHFLDPMFGVPHLLMARIPRGGLFSSPARAETGRLDLGEIFFISAICPASMNPRPRV